MKISLVNGVKEIKSWFDKKSIRVKILVIAAVLLVIGLGGNKIINRKAPAPQYQTTQAEKGTLIKTVSASGNITSGNRLNITTEVTGTVIQVYAKNGDQVTKGQKIAEVTPDQDSQQRQTSAWSGYLSAKNQLFSAQNNLYQLQITEFTANQKFINDAIARNLATDDPTYIEENAAWLAAEASYKNQSNIISQAQIAVYSAWLSYQQLSSTILSPAAGTVSDLTLAPGLPLITQAGSSNNSTTSQVVGTITLPQGKIQATVDISEIDVPNVQAGQKVTLILDAFPNETFTGKVLLVDTNGQVSSGVTTYPAIILLDTDRTNIYPNMGATADIITTIDNNVLLVPSSAVQTVNGQAQVRVMSNGQISTVDVVTGNSNDTQTEITSGLNEGDTVITSTVTSGTSSTGTNRTGTSVFGGGGFGGARIIGR
jgi:RND family efflux transporter MFP subunit